VDDTDYLPKIGIGWDWKMVDDGSNSILDGFDNS